MPAASGTSDSPQPLPGTGAFGFVYLMGAPNTKVFLARSGIKPFSKHSRRAEGEQGAPGRAGPRKGVGMSPPCPSAHGHSLAGRVHLGRVEQVDPALVGDGHQLLGHLGRHGHTAQGGKTQPQPAGNVPQQGKPTPGKSQTPRPRDTPESAPGEGETPKYGFTAIPPAASPQELISSPRSCLSGRQPRI